MPILQKVIDAAPALAVGVVSDWDTLATNSPWLNVPQPLDEDGLAELIRLLAEAARERESGSRKGASRQLIRAALRHGRERRDDGFSEDLLFREYHLLRRGLWERLSDIGPDEAGEAILRIDAEITMATAASMHGFHTEGAPEPDPELVEMLTQRWSF